MSRGLFVQTAATSWAKRQLDLDDELCQGQSKRGSSSHLVKRGQDFGVLVLVWN